MRLPIRAVLRNLPESRETLPQPDLAAHATRSCNDRRRPIYNPEALG